MPQEGMWNISEDPEHLSIYGNRPDGFRHALYSAVVTLTLAVLGSTSESVRGSVVNERQHQ